MLDDTFVKIPLRGAPCGTPNPEEPYPKTVTLYEYMDGLG